MKQLIHTQKSWSNRRFNTCAVKGQPYSIEPGGGKLGGGKMAVEF